MIKLNHLLAVYIQAFRKAIGVKIKEESEIIEGEVGGLITMHCVRILLMTYLRAGRCCVANGLLTFRRWWKLRWTFQLTRAFKRRCASACAVFSPGIRKYCNVLQRKYQGLNSQQRASGLLTDAAMPAGQVDNEDD